MLDTANTKAQHYTDGCFHTGTGEDVVMIIGSCRIFGYANYFDRWNRSWSPNPFTICVVNIVNFAMGPEGQSVNSDEFTVQFETNPVLLEMIKRCRILIHEHAENFGCFNTHRSCDKNIFKLGIDPEIEISVPNFHDVFLFENDYRNCGMQPPENYIEKGEDAVVNFTRKCQLTSFPEFGDIFRDTWRSIRYFWTPNHISSQFSTTIFGLMNEKFLKMPLTDEFWDGARSEDLFKEPHTEPTQRDIEGYGLRW